MALTAYEIEASWVPDATKFNSNAGIEYVAWRLGLDAKGETALWVFGQVDTGASALATFLPVSYTEITLTDDLTKYGYQRNILAQQSIADLEARFTDVVSKISGDVTDGYY